jgi:integrase
MRLNKINVARLALPEGKNEVLVFDETLPGFGVRLRAGGKKTWIAQYRIGSKQRRMTLGTIEAVDPDEARKRARSVISKAQLGLDPQTEKVEARAQAAITLGNVAEKYLLRAATKLAPRTLAETERHLRKHWLPLSELPFQRVRRADVSAQLAEIAGANGPFAANRARASLSALFSWAIGEGLLDSNPVVGTNKAIDETPRDRVLTDDELTLIWRHAGDLNYGAIIRLLISTGQRREEVGGLRRSELRLRDGIWSISAERTKNGRPHDVPLSTLALDILQAQYKREDRDLLFGAREGAFQGWSKAKEALDRRMLVALQNAHGEQARLKPWRLHDIRRTVATRLGDLGVLPHVVEAILNHISGHKAGVAGIYNRAIYAPKSAQRCRSGPSISWHSSGMPKR